MSGCLSDSILKAFGAVVCRSRFAVENLTLGTKLLNLDWDWGAQTLPPTSLHAPGSPKKPPGDASCWKKLVWKRLLYELTVTGLFSKDESLLVYIIRIVGNLLLCPWDKRLSLTPPSQSVKFQLFINIEFLLFEYFKDIFPKGGKNFSP